MSLPTLAKLLGYAGLIPFATLGVGVWVVPDAWLADMHAALLGYAAVILSFMGAVHWGLAMAADAAAAQRQLGLSVLPALLAWLALLLPAAYGYALLLLGFAGLCLVDRAAGRVGLVPEWYPSLRVALTGGVVVSLLIAGLGLSR
jgi:hypothetical protein